MLRRYRQIQIQLHQLMDACLFAISFWLAYVLRSDPRVIYHFHLALVGPGDSSVWLYVSLLLIPAGPLVLEAQGFYDRAILCSRRTTFWQLFKGCVFLTLGVVLGLFLFRMSVPRFVVIWFGGISLVLVFLKEEVLRLASKSKLARDQYRRCIILAGPREETDRMESEILADSPGEVEVLAHVDLNKTPVESLIELVHEHSANGVVLSAKRASFDQVEAAIQACELEGVETWVVADFFKTQISHASLDDFYGRPVLVFRSAPGVSWQSALKTIMDYALSAIALLILGPLVLAPIALLVKLTSRGPVFFRQLRSGLNGRPFTIYKFRTMVTNAEELKQDLQTRNEMTGPVFKIAKDPRITPLGRLLRKFSVDEFPQLFNVLRGEMSLVGPRPLPVDEVKRFDDLAHRRRLSVKPGLTCLWQVRGRSNVSDFKDWVRLDLEYIDNWSLWLDVKIMWWTVPIVLAGTGAR